MRPITLLDIACFALIGAAALVALAGVVVSVGDAFLRTLGRA